MPCRHFAFMRHTISGILPRYAGTVCLLKTSWRYPIFGVQSDGKKSLIFLSSDQWTCHLLFVIYPWEIPCEISWYFFCHNYTALIDWETSWWTYSLFCLNHRNLQILQSGCTGYVGLPHRSLLSPFTQFLKMGRSR